MLYTVNHSLINLLPDLPIDIREALSPVDILMYNSETKTYSILDMSSTEQVTKSISVLRKSKEYELPLLKGDIINHTNGKMYYVMSRTEDNLLQVKDLETLMVDTIVTDSSIVSKWTPKQDSLTFIGKVQEGTITGIVSPFHKALLIQSKSIAYPIEFTLFVSKGGLEDDRV